MNRGGGGAHRRRFSGVIPALQRSWSTMVAARSSLVRGRSRGGGLQALGCGGVASPRRRGCSALRSEGRRWLGLRGGGASGMRWVLGGSRGDLKEGARYLGVRARVWKAGKVSAGITGSVARALRGGDEAGRRGPRVSGGARVSGLRGGTRGERVGCVGPCRMSGAGVCLGHGGKR